MESRIFNCHKKSGRAVDFFFFFFFITKWLTNRKYKARETDLFLQTPPPPRPTTSISAWQPVSKPWMKLLSLFSPPFCLFGLDAQAPAGEVDESPMRVQACSKRTEKPWEARCFYCNTNHGNHFTSLSAHGAVEKAPLATGETQT